MISCTSLMIVRPRVGLAGVWLVWLLVGATGRATAEPANTSAVGPLEASAPAVDVAAVRRGWELLVDTPLLPSDFSQSTVDELWQSWPEPLRQRAANASLRQRRQMTLDRYGLTRRPELVAEGNQVRFEVDEPDGLAASGDGGEDEPIKPMQYVVDSSGDWTMNCLSCHGGSVYGTPTPGAPNNRYALQTLTEEIRATKFRIGQPLGRMELGSLFIPLGTTHGTTNAVVFGMGLMQFRDEALNLVDRAPESFVHHDMDAPPWWYFYKRPYLYIDGFAQKGHRGLMQFTLVPENGADFYRENEERFRDLAAFLSALRAPRFEGAVNAELVASGKAMFEQTCSQCHGTYDAAGNRDRDTYPGVTIAMDELGTDPVRFDALSVEGRQTYARSWFAHAGEVDEQETRVDPVGYVAPPLDGVWASAPYFHNGSVPTLWHVLHPDDRPTVWRRTEIAMDEQRVGLTIAVVDRIPLESTDVAQRRETFDTRRLGKSNAGHDFPDLLSELEKRAVLEYLKTL